ncbi:hypothetical protein VZQ01_24650 [Myxococcus faecalis]|uniref:DUF7151 family protein n=1 Tax=Myxococcus faecalis TaxID=3115646 RepID=UPI0038D17640
MRWYWLVPLAWLCGCDDIRLGSFLESRPTLSRKEGVPPGEHCAHGGQVAYAGEDLNGDGLLADDEVTRAEYLCTPAPPQARLRTRGEPAGEHCEHGGLAVETGVDTNANGTLEDDEVDDVDYFCATPLPGVLVHLRREPMGETCPLGGQVTQAGLDANGDGLLQAGEISREVVGCMEPARVLSRLEALGVGGACGTQSRYAVESGPDHDGDGALDDDEVRAVSQLCASTMNTLSWRHADEPAGMNCVSGGVVVAAGNDLDQDGVLQQSEVLDVAYVCHPSATYDGDYVVTTDADVAALQGISRIRGDLVVSSPSLLELALPGLEAVDGSLRIQSNPQLSRVVLTSLRFVREDLSFSDHDVLRLVSLGPTNAPVPQPVYVGGSLRVERNLQLPWAGLSSVAPRKGLRVTDNFSLLELGPLPFVDTLSGDVVIERNRLLRKLKLSQLTHVGANFFLRDNPSLTSLEGLDLLRGVGGDFSVMENGLLADVAALTRLEAVGGAFVLETNANLKHVSLPRLSRVEGLFITQNPALTTLGPLPALRDTGHAFVLVLNDNLDLVTGLEGLRALNGTLAIGGNPKLTSLMAFEPLESLTHLQINENHALPSLAGLHNLRTLDTLSVRENPALTEFGLQALTQVRGSFVVRDNPQLSQCHVTARADAVFTGPEDERSLYGNDTTAVCTPP